MGCGDNATAPHYCSAQSFIRVDSSLFVFSLSPVRLFLRGSVVSFESLRGFLLHGHGFVAPESRRSALRCFAEVEGQETVEKLPQLGHLRRTGSQARNGAPICFT